MEFELRVKHVADFALSLGYKPQDIDAGVLFFKRRFGLESVPGHWLAGGEFQSAEETQTILSVRSRFAPSPMKELKAAKTANHCAELTGSCSVHVKRISRTLQVAFGENDFYGFLALRILKGPIQGACETGTAQPSLATPDRAPFERET